MQTLKALEKIGNCQTQVEIPVFRFKRKEYQEVLSALTKKKELEEKVVSCIELLDQHGINSKQIVKEILKEAIKQSKGVKQ